MNNLFHKFIAKPSYVVPAKKRGKGESEQVLEALSGQARPAAKKGLSEAKPDDNKHIDMVGFGNLLRYLDDNIVSLEIYSLYAHCLLASDCGAVTWRVVHACFEERGLWTLSFPLDGDKVFMPLQNAHEAAALYKLAVRQQKTCVAVVEPFLKILLKDSSLLATSYREEMALALSRLGGLLKLEHLDEKGAIKVNLRRAVDIMRFMLLETWRMYTFTQSSTPVSLVLPPVEMSVSFLELEFTHLHAIVKHHLATSHLKSSIH